MKSFDGADERHLLVTRNDELYEAFPDLVLLDDGTVLCLYRESDAHAAAWSRVALIESRDRGQSWHGHRIVLEAPSRPYWNLPRISALRDGRLVVIGDRGYDNFLIWSADRGRTWSAPQPTPIQRPVPRPGGGAGRRHPAGHRGTREARLHRALLSSAAAAPGAVSQ